MVYYIWSYCIAECYVLSIDNVRKLSCSQKNSYDKISGDLDNVEWLYRKLQKSELLSFIGSTAIPEVDGELNQLERLQIVRNTFIHQQPDLYLFTFEELCELIKLTIKLTRFLVSKSERMALGNIVSKEAMEAQLDLVERHSQQVHTHYLPGKA